MHAIHGQRKCIVKLYSYRFDSNYVLCRVLNKYEILLTIVPKNMEVVLLTRCQVALDGNLIPFPRNGWGVRSVIEDESWILCLVLHHCLASPHPCRQLHKTCVIYQACAMFG